MGTIALNYDSIYSAAKNAKKVASNADTYVKGLQKNIFNKIDSLHGGMTSNTTDAKSHTQSKIDSLNTKKDTYNTYAENLEKFVDDDTTGAKAVDKKVAKMFKSDAKQFRDNNNIKINPVTQFFTWLCCEVNNSSDLGRTIGDISTNVKNWLVDRGNDIKDWYRYKGGKYVANIGKALLAIGIAVVTIVVTVCTGGIGLVAICAIAAAAIAIVDGVVTCVNNVRALNSESSDPAWAKRTSKIDKLSTALRKGDFGSKFLNTVANIGAGALDLTEFVCTAITLVDGVVKLGKNLPAIKNLIGDESKGIMKYILDKGVRDCDGKAVVTFKSLRNGLKTFVTDSSVRTQIVNKFKADFHFHFSPATLKDTLRYEWNFNIKAGLNELRYSSAARSRFAEEFMKSGKKVMTKGFTDINKAFHDLTGNNAQKSWKAVLTLGKSAKKGYDGIVKLASGDGLSWDNVAGKMKDTCFDMNGLANSINKCYTSLGDLKKNVDSMTKSINNIKTAPAY